ncbi:hypothetical protein [Mycolicibacterium sp.]|uniref:hypothetical protein n=1 Tax=Mycolicibacterium sp. TaxID=2320850 RepID=UPI0037C63CEB
MTEPAKPTGGCSDEVLDGHWPDDLSAADYDTHAAYYLKRAGDAEHAAQSTYQQQIHTDTETDGAAFDAAGEAFGVDATKILHNQADLLNISAWHTYCAQTIRAAKTAMVEAVTGHQAAHDAPLKKTRSKNNAPNSLTQAEKDEDLEKWQSAVVDSAGYLGSALDAAERAVQAAADAPGTLKPPPGMKTPEVPSVEAGNAQPNMPSSIPGTAGTPGASTPGGGGTPEPAAPAPATPLDPSVFAAPAAAAAPPAAAPAASAGGPEGAAGGDPSSAMGGMPMGGMPMGMPMGGQPQQGAGGGAPMSAPGGGAGASPLIDSLGKVADSAAQGGDDKKPLTPERLEQLIKESGLADGGDDQGVDLDGDGKPDKPGEHGKPEPGVAPASALNSPANTNPALNQPPVPAHLASPSPASAVSTPAPERVAVPMTELSHDLSTPAQQQSSSSSAANGGGSAQSLASPPVQQQAGGALGAYPPGGMGAGMPMGGGMPMAPMGGMGAMAAGGGGAPGGGGPVLAAALPTTAAAVTVGHERVHTPPPPPRVSALPPEHALAENHLASLIRVYGTAGWAGTTIAIGVVDDGSGAPRYVMATSDGLSLVPLGVAVPAGIAALGMLAFKDVDFYRDWGGYRRAGRKLIAWVDRTPNMRLTYLVSSDTGTPATNADGSLVEVHQTVEEAQRLSGGSPAIAPRYHIPGLRMPGLPDKDVAEYLRAAIKTWGFHDLEATDMAIGKVRVMTARWTDIRDRDPEVPAITATYLAAEGLSALAAGNLQDAAVSLTQLLPLRAYDLQPA